MTYYVYNGYHGNLYIADDKAKVRAFVDRVIENQGEDWKDNFKARLKIIQGNEIILDDIMSD